MTTRIFIIPFFSYASEAARLPWAGLELANLRTYLRNAHLLRSYRANAYNLSPPHEIFLAQALDIPHEDGCVPWAAYETQTPEPCAWITPCHWHVGVDSIQMSAVDDLRLSAAHAQQLLAAMRPFFEQDGIDLELHAPGRWLARGAVFEGLATASLDRVVGRHVSAWMPMQTHAATLRRLQNEMQMLLYTHPVNDTRVTQGLLPINSFWIHGAGALRTHDRIAQKYIQLDDRLKSPALQQNAQAWRQAMQSLDQELIAPLTQSRDMLANTQLVLCGEQAYQVWQAQSPSVYANFRRIFLPRRAVNLHTILSNL